MPAMRLLVGSALTICFGWACRDYTYYVSFGPHWSQKNAFRCSHFCSWVRFI